MLTTQTLDKDVGIAALNEAVEKVKASIEVRVARWGRSPNAHAQPQHPAGRSGCCNGRCAPPESKVRGRRAVAKRMNPLESNADFQ